MNLLAESEQYEIIGEYESVTLKYKVSGKTITIGDFYGDPQVAIISEDEKFCAIGGCGVIVYFIQEPFEEYEYHKLTPQWKEWNRTDSEGILWVEDIKYMDNCHIEVEQEGGRKILINVYEDGNLILE